MQWVDKDENVNAEHDENHIYDDFGDVIIVVDYFENVLLVFNDERHFTAGHESFVYEVNEVDDQKNRREDEGYSEWLNFRRIFLQIWIN